MSLADTLLALLAATSWDKGEELLRTLRQSLGELVPFDAGELVLLRANSVLRLALTDDGEPVVGEALARHVAGLGAPLRLDDLPELRTFPATYERMLALGLRSVIGAPLSGAGAPEGALVLARRYGWAFVAVPANDLWTIAGMVGLCLERSFALTQLRKELETQFLKSGEMEAALAAARSDVRAIQDHSTSQKGELESQLAALTAETERQAGELARLGAELRATLEDLAAAREGEHEAARARASAKEELERLRIESSAGQERLEAALGELKTARGELDARLDEILAERDDLRERLQETKAEVEALSARPPVAVPASPTPSKPASPKRRRRRASPEPAKRCPASASTAQSSSEPPEDGASPEPQGKPMSSE